MNVPEMQAIVAAITYKPGWHVLFLTDAGPMPYVQIEVDESTEAAIDAAKRDGSRQAWRSGRKFLSEAMCRQEIVGAVFGMIQDAESHEMREWFRYRGASIYNPHLDPDALVPVARKKASFVTRENAMTMEEPAS